MRDRVAPLLSHAGATAASALPQRGQNIKASSANRIAANNGFQRASLALASARPSGVLLITEIAPMTSSRTNAVPMSISLFLFYEISIVTSH